MSDLVQRLIQEAKDWKVDDVVLEAATRIAALEKACQAYLDAYDSATGTVYVEPVIRAVMEGKNV